MDDNAPVHRKKNMKNYIIKNNIKTTKESTQSPNLNMIENIRLYLKRVLENRVNVIN